MGFNQCCLSLGRKRGIQFIQVEKRERKERKRESIRESKGSHTRETRLPNILYAALDDWPNLTYLGFRLRADCSEESSTKSHRPEWRKSQPIRFKSFRCQQPPISASAAALAFTLLSLEVSLLSLFLDLARRLHCFDTC